MSDKAFDYNILLQILKCIFNLSLENFSLPLKFVHYNNSFLAFVPRHLLSYMLPTSRDLQCDIKRPFIFTEIHVSVCMCICV